ncbi:MAG: hypothetical protein K2X64_02995 [Rhodocyclaceae bacterium]|nr:hypothetical protein [Rhodocyclaceae bacterium]
MQRQYKHFFPLVGLLIGGLLFALSVDRVRQMGRPNVTPEIQVVLPLFVQVGMAAGDRYLAANAGAIRSLITSTARMGDNEYAILGSLQTAVSWLNPAHEDNYYTAAAILPWNGQLDSAQLVLQRATYARPNDFQPAFFYAFHLLHFKQDPVAASGWLSQAARRMTNEHEQLVMQNYAARWMDRSRDLDNAIAVVADMAKQTRRADFRSYLEQRIKRLENLKYLREHALVFEQRFGRPLHAVDELINAGILSEIPSDPFGFGYAMGRDGLIILRQAKAQ